MKQDDVSCRNTNFKWGYDRRIGNCNLCNCKLTRETSRDFNGIRTHGLCVTLWCSTDWAVKTHTLGAGQFVDFVLTRERNETWRWCDQQNVVYSKKEKSFWQCYESVGKIIDISFMYLVFGENEQCELMCKDSRKLHPMFKPF